jgi:hypothetical protein
MLNGLVAKHLRTRQLQDNKPRDTETVFQHPWRTTVERITLPGTTSATGGTWKVMVRAGCINDQLAAYTYRKQGDPRGWTMPAGFVSAFNYGPNSQVVDRTSFDSDSLWNPPWLLTTGPDYAAQNLGDYQPYVGERPAYFTGVNTLIVSNLGRIGGAQNGGTGTDITDWPLFTAGVICSATPIKATLDFTKYIPAATTQLKHFRLYTGQMPIQTDNVDAGGAIELARLYLLRNPAAPVTGDQLFVEQLHFWCMQSIAVQPSLSIGTLEGSIDSGLGDFGLGALGILSDEFLDDAQNLLNESQTIEFFTC